MTSRISTKILIILAGLFFSNIATAVIPYELSEIPSLNPSSPFGYMNVVFFADGYQTSQKTLFENDVNKIRTGLLKVSPYKEYRDFFQFYTVFPTDNSNQRGVSHPRTATNCNIYPPDETVITSVNNAFGSTLDGAPNSHSLIIPTKTNLIYEIMGDAFPGYYGQYQSIGNTGFYIVILANTMDSGFISVRANTLSTSNIVTMGNAFLNASAGSVPVASEILAHELGHAIGKLEDEYGEIGHVYSDGPNLMDLTTPILYKWKKMIHKNTPLPTPSGTHVDEIGQFQDSDMVGWYRPADNCKMRYHDEAEFCAVCLNQLVRSFPGYSNIINSCEPGDPSNPDSSKPGQTISVQVRASEKINLFAYAKKTHYDEDINKKVTSTPAFPQNIKVCSPSNSIVSKWVMDGQTVLGKEGNNPTDSEESLYEYEVDGSKLSIGHHQLILNANDKSIFAGNLNFSANSYDSLTCNFDIEVVP